MAGGFKRSSRFGIVGVIVVMILVAVIALTMGSGQANPKGALALIFGVLAVFFVVLLILQRSDLERAAGTSASGTERAAAEGGHEIENPTTMSEPELWAALAVKPIDDQAIRARSAGWDAGRRSLNLGVVVVVLIFLTVPSMYLTESFAPLLIGGPLIVIVALYGAWRAMSPGGELDQGYENVGLAMAPLGLEVIERPTVNIEMRDPVTPRMGPHIHGALVLKGERHGRPVSARLGDEERTGVSEITIGVSTPPFHAAARDGRVRAGKGDEIPAEIAETLKAVPNSTRWKGVKVEGGPDGIIVTRRGGEQADWLCDLWLAERLASC